MIHPVFSQSDGFVFIAFYIVCPCPRFALLEYVLPVGFSRILDWILDWISEILTGSAVADS